MASKIKITIGEHTQHAIIIPAQLAGVAASLFADAHVFERDGYYSTSGWKLSEKGISIEYTEGTELEPTHPLVEKAQKEMAETSNRWLDAHLKNQTLEKELAELKAQLAGIQSVTRCEVETPVEPSQVESDEEEAF